jgi:hypothetical protein
MENRINLLETLGAGVVGTIYMGAIMAVMDGIARGTSVDESLSYTSNLVLMAASGIYSVSRNVKMQLEERV